LKIAHKISYIKQVPVGPENKQLLKLKEVFRPVQPIDYSKFYAALIQAKKGVAQQERVMRAGSTRNKNGFLSRY
jgi:hypothetical protein